MLPAEAKLQPETPDALMRVTPEMRRFAERIASGRNGIDSKSKALADALNDKNGLNLQYDAPTPR